jgi:hypothetical protein
LRPVFPEHHERRARALASVFALALIAAACTNPPPSSSSSPPAGGATAEISGGARWLPTPGTPWQWQLTGTVDTSVDAAVFDIDLFNNDATVVAALHAKGRKVICYMEAGAWEPYRPDAQGFPKAVLGKNLRDWPDHRWLDIRDRAALGPLIEARLDLCRGRGFDGVEFDDLEVYAADSGFPLTIADQLAYNRFLAEAAHRRGLSAGLKNALSQVETLLPLFEFAINEQCFEFAECARLLPFVSAGKAVFNAEYNLEQAQFCPLAKSMRLSSIKKRVGLDAWRVACS